MSAYSSAKTSESGFTLFELLVVIGFSSILTAVAVANLREFSQSSKTSSALVQSYVKEVRARAISQTRAYRLSPVSDREIQATFADKCSSPTASFVRDRRLTLKIPSDTKLITPTWSVCFSTRGIADSNIHILLLSKDGSTKDLELLLGGATREVV